MTVPNDTLENLIHVIEKITANLHIFFHRDIPPTRSFQGKIIIFHQKEQIRKSSNP